MSKRVLNGLVRLGLIATFVGITATDAWAVCLVWKRIGGSQLCMVDSAGSLILDAQVQGFGGSVCTPGAGTDCGKVDFLAFGTLNTDTTTGCNTIVDQLDPACALSAVAIYQNKGGNTNLNLNAQPFVKVGFLQDSSDFELCDKKGKCVTQVKLSLDGYAPPPQNRNWKFVGAYVLEYKSVKRFCPGGYDIAGSCCETDERVGNVCAADYGDGKPLTTLELCELPLASFLSNPGSKIPYVCKDLKTCGGWTGVSCPAIP